MWEILGVATNYNDMRALSVQELADRSASQWEAIRPANRSIDYYLGMTNWQPPQRPLDERFADFKARLAAAIAKRANTSSPH
jgi:hypothetical protein